MTSIAGRRSRKNSKLPRLGVHGLGALWFQPGVIPITPPTGVRDVIHLNRILRDIRSIRRHCA